MFIGTDRYSSRLRRLWRRNLLLYVVTNLLFNTIIPYYQFEDPGAVYVFNGEMCWARFLLPMALLLPFIITIDILKKTIELCEKEETGIRLPRPFAKYKFIIKMASTNALITILFVLVPLCLLPADKSYQGKTLALITGLLGGFLAVVFTVYPLNRLKRLSELSG